MFFKVIVQHLAACSFNQCCSHLSYMLLGKVGLGFWWNAGICCLSCNEKINILYSPADTCWTFCITMQYSHVLNSHVTATAKEELCYTNKNCWVDIFGLWWLCGGTVNILAGVSGKSEKLSFLPRVPVTGFGSLCAVWGLVIDRLLINAARPKHPCAVADKGMCSVCCLFAFTGVAHCLGQGRWDEKQHWLSAPQCGCLRC